MIQENRSLRDYARSVLSNMVEVANGFRKVDLIGVGYRAQNKGNKLKLMNVGLSAQLNSNQLKVLTLKFLQTLKLS